MHSVKIPCQINDLVHLFIILYEAFQKLVFFYNTFQYLIFILPPSQIRVNNTYIFEICRCF